MIAVADDPTEIEPESASDFASHSEFDVRFTSEFEDDVRAEPEHSSEPALLPESAQPARSRKGIGGPKTPEGRARSSRNALKHGLRAKTLLPDDLAELIERRIAEFTNELRPESPVQAWLVAQAARASVQLDQCAEMELMNMEWRIMRAESVWEIDARSAIADVALRLPRDPSRVAATLRLSAHGVAWILERLEALATILERKGVWTEAQTRLALDLLGVPHEMRDEETLLPALGLSGPDAAGLADLVRAEIERLRTAKAEWLDALDEEERIRTLMGAPTREDASTRTLKRYQSEHRRVLRWALQEFHQLKAQEREPDGPPARDDQEAAPAPRQTNSPAAGETARTNSPAASRAAAVERTGWVDCDASWMPQPQPQGGSSISIVPPIGFAGTSALVRPASRDASVGNRRDRRARAKLARQAATRIEKMGS